ncbi:MAG: FAD-dependent oxidoreductase [Chitinophagaceae bacterium]|nr:FAD-dependent oxidoreductase [Chitinophagaceae bacterium]
MRLRYAYMFMICCFISISYIHAQQTIRTDVLVIGGGASGISAGLQSARLGVPTIIAESTPWLGGMITSAGVAAFDGNHNLPSGIWAEFRENLYKVYRGPAKVATGWVSMTQFEPHIGDSIFKAMAAKEKKLKVLFKHHFVKILKEKNRVIGAVFTTASNKQINILAKQTIDATELGDAIAKAGVAYDLGMEAGSVTGENVGVEKSNDIIQDITYTAIVKDYGVGKDCTIAKPVNYDPREFDGACTDYYFDKSRLKPNVDAKKMLDYGRLPHNKFMLNWPGYGNDIYLNIVELTDEERERALVKAKQQTYRFIYFIQHELGFKHIGIADDEYPTADRLPLIPYHREARRIQGIVRFTVNAIAKPFEGDPLYRTGISVGDYPIDHHHRKNPEAPQHLHFYPVPSFNVPLGSLIPKSVEGIIAAEKCISVSNIVNGTTRLQPSVLLIGQAAGTLAALSVQSNTEARNIPVRKVQTTLLNSKAYIMPYIDVPVSHPHFAAIQRIGATGILKGTGIPKNWANQTWFYPDSLVNNAALKKDMAAFTNTNNIKEQGYLTQGEVIALLSAYANKQKIEAIWKSYGWEVISEEAPITRLQLAVLIDAIIHPFETKPVNHQGFFKSPY